MNKKIQMILEENGFTVNHANKSITIELYGIDISANYELDYDTYNKMTFPQALKLKSIFTVDEIQDFLRKESHLYTFPRVAEMIDEHTFDMDDRDLDCISNGWKLNKKVLEDKFRDLETSILYDLQAAKSIYITLYDFDKFLDEINIVGYSNNITVSSPYSNIKTYGLTWDDAYMAVGTYIEKLVERGELIIEGDCSPFGFELCETLNDKFGIDDYYDEDEE